MERLAGTTPATVTRPNEQFHARISSDTVEVARIRKTFETFLTSQGFDSRCVEEIGLVLNEALANIIRHAYLDQTDQPIEISAWCDPTGLHLMLRDWGIGVVPRIKDECEKDPHVPGGVGLPCMKKLTDSLEFIPQPDGMLLKLFRLRNR